MVAAAAMKSPKLLIALDLLDWKVRGTIMYITVDNVLLLLVDVYIFCYTQVCVHNYVTYILSIHVIYYGGLSFF